MRNQRWRRMGLTMLMSLVAAGVPISLAGEAPSAGEAALEAGRPEKAVRLFEQQLEKNPEDAHVLWGMARAQEALGHKDRALGYYQAAAEQVKSEEPTVLHRKIVYQAKQKARTLGAVDDELADLRHGLTREIKRLSREWIQKDDLEPAIRAYELLSQLNRDEPEYARLYYRLRCRAAVEEWVEPPRGTRSLFNQIDLDGWQVQSGTWCAKKGILYSSGWGRIVWPEQYGTLRLLLEYRAELPREANQRGHTLTVHADAESGWPGAHIWLVGKNAGMVTGLEPETEYTRPEGDGRCLVRPAPFAPGKWNRLEVRLKKASIRVELNGKLVFENKRFTDVRGYGGEERALPGALSIQARAGPLEIRSIFVRGRKGR